MATQEQEGSPKQQIVERIKNSTNILVTVSRNPSVDELSAALGLTLMLNKMDKHATAVYSGATPPAIAFLEPDKTFEHSVDSLRDFIIALDKDKADRLRYKVEDDVVRIFITPYKTTISEKDLQFSQGDFNVELIIAVGVDKREDLDAAITAHGRILHDATVVTINTDDEKNTLGSIDWQDTAASSYSEMFVSLSEALQSSLIDAQIATALLTGIVAATKRFANTHTTPRVMTMAAQLMAAGANQQLIASKLEEAQAIPKQSTPVDKDGATPLDEGASKKLEKPPKPPKQAEKPVEKPAPPSPPPPPPSQAGETKIDHDEKKAEPRPKKTEAPAPKKTDEEADRELDAAITAATAPESTAPGLSVEDLKKDLAAASQDVDTAAAGIASPPQPATTLPPAPQPAGRPVQAKGWRDQEMQPPSMGGTLNATTEEAAKQKRKAEQDSRNRTILTHDTPTLGEPAEPQTPFNSYAAGAPQYEPPTVDVFSQNPSETNLPPSGQPAQAPQQPPAPASSEQQIGDARQAVEQALSAAPFNAAHQPLEAVGAQSLPPLHEQQPAPVAPPQQPADMPLPPPPPPPDASGALPPLPNMQNQPTPQPQQNAGAPTLPPIASPANAQVQPQSNDPGQFKIPGQ